MIISSIIPIVSSYEKNITNSINFIFVDDDGTANYTSIQDAINNASEGDIIFVYSGIYEENIEISKSIFLIGENPTNTIIDGRSFRYDRVIRIYSSNVTIMNFKIIANSRLCCAIDIYSNDCLIKNNILHQNYSENSIAGISIKGHNNIIENNDISNFFWCVQLMDSSKNKIINNNFFNYRWIFPIVQRCHLQKINHIKRYIIGNDFKGNFYNRPKLSPSPIIRWAILRDSDPSYPNALALVVPLLIDFDWNPAKKSHETKLNPIAIIDTSMGPMFLELFKEEMPITTENFIDLANINFFNNLVFHRVIDDFVIQGGGYYSNGTRKLSPFDPIVLETSPDINHIDGAISMARTSNPNSATSQFFICDGAQPFLDGEYAAFGVIIKGFNVLRDIAAVQTTTKHGLEDWPINEVLINNITILNS